MSLYWQATYFSIHGCGVVRANIMHMIYLVILRKRIIAPQKQESVVSRFRDTALLVSQYTLSWTVHLPNWQKQDQIPMSHVVHCAITEPPVDVPKHTQTNQFLEKGMYF